MARKFIEADHEAALDIQVRIGDVLPANHLARFIVRIIEQLDFSSFYEAYGESGAPAYAPEVLFGILIYGYATGIFSSRKLEKATYESVPFIFIAGGLHPDHDTLNTFRSRFLAEISELFTDVLLLANLAGLLQLGNISVDGSKIHADASKSKAISGGHLLALEAKLRQEVDELMALAETDEVGAWPEGFDAAEEIRLREHRLAGLAEAKAVLAARADERYEQELAAYNAKMAERAAKTEETGKKPGGRPPQPPTPGIRDKDQYNFTDPESRIVRLSSRRSHEERQ